MHFTQLRSFQAVALEGSFTGAAERLNLSQPTITQQVRELESIFRVELFHRQGRRIKLSEVGKSLLMVTERLFTTNEEAIELLESASGLGTGHLRISAVGPLDVILAIATTTISSVAMTAKVISFFSAAKLPVVAIARMVAAKTVTIVALSRFILFLS